MDIIKCKGNKPLRGILCAPDLMAHFQHFGAFRTEVCRPHDCHLCLRGAPRKQIGYIPILLDKNEGRGFLEVCYSGFQYFDRKMQDAGTCERQIVRVHRVGGHDKGKMFVTFEGLCRDDVRLPRFPTVQAWLSQLWGVVDLDPAPSDQTGVNSRLSEKTTPIIFRENAG